MSSYTTQLKTYIESWSQDDWTKTTRERIEIGRPHLFDFDYPIFNSNYKKDFETHFIRYFYMREIGTETEGLFKFNLETWLLVNMPYYNKLFESELIDFDPLENSKRTITSNKKNKDTSKLTSNETMNSNTEGSNNVSNFSRTLDSNNPDSRLTITTDDGKGIIEYASSITEDKELNIQSSTASTDEGKNKTDNTTTDKNEDYTSMSEGKIGVQSYSKMVNEYRDTFIRIEKQIFEEMQQLFMLVY